MTSRGGSAVLRPRSVAQPLPLALLLVVLAVALLGAAPAARANEPDTTTADDRSAGSEHIEAVIGAARAYLGVPYRVGSEGPSLFDCSGLVFRAFTDVGQAGLIGGARMRAAGYQRWFAGLGRLVALEEDAQRGDLVMYDNGAHIGIYLGEGRVISALTSGVAIHSLRGINQAVTGFLKVDWTGEGRGPITDPPPLPEVPEEPASLVPAVPWLALPAGDVLESQPAGDERVDMRTATSRTFEAADGTFTTEFFSRPIFYQAPDSEDWLSVDLRFAPVEGEQGRAAVAASPVELSLAPSDAEEGFLSLGAAGHALDVRLVAGRDGGSAEPVVSEDGRYVDYFDVLPAGIGLRAVARADGFQGFLVLPEQPREASFTFALRSSDLTPTLEADGSISLRDPEDVVVGRLPRPFLLDSSDTDGTGGGVYSAAANFELALDGDRQLVTVNVARRYLAEAVYPAYVNLALVDFPAPAGGAQLAFASSRHPNANFDAYLRPEAPGYLDLWHGRQPGTRTQNEVYLRFDGVADVLGTVDLEAAALEMLPYWRPDESATIVVRRVTEAWGAAGLTWATRPPADTDTNVGTFETRTGEWASFDAAAHVAGLLAGDVDHGLVLGVEAGRDSWTRLAGGGGVEPSGLGPRLRVTWTGLRPTALARSSSASPSLVLDWSHAELAPDQTRFEVQVSTDNFATTVAESGVVRRRAGSATEWQVPAGSLTEGRAYSWRVRVKYEGAESWSPWSDSETFTFGLSAVEARLY